MDLKEAILCRHSVRQYVDEPLTESQIEALQSAIAECNRESGLHIQLVLNEPKAFDSFMAHYGKFSGVSNYIAMIGKKSANLDEQCGYYGEKLVLLAQQLGLNTCWVAMTFRKIASAFQVDKGEKLAIVISIGKGKTEGVPHKSRPASDIASYNGEWPTWFKEGVEASLLAPTAVNQQKFLLQGDGNTVKLTPSKAFFAKVDAGIVRCHFEIGAGTENFHWC